MKVLLLRPRPDPETIGLQHLMICEPLELEYLAAGIADLDVECTIVDLILETDPVERFLEEHRPDIVGVTAYITHVAIARDYCQAAKRLSPGCLTVVGGVHAEVVPEDFRDDAVDCVVTADGIATFRRLVEACLEGQPTAGLEGVWDPDGPAWPKTATFTAPPPDRSKVARYRDRYYYLFHNPCALIKTSFGCPHRCRFCFCRHITGDQYFARDLDDVIAEIATIPEREIYIVDDNFLVSRERVLGFCERLEAAGLKKRFLIYGRADFIARNEDVMRTFVRCGLRAVIVGLESCSTGELDRYHKGSTVRAHEEAVDVLRRLGVDLYATLILGMDWEAPSFAALGRWLNQRRVRFINLQPLTPLPGTPLLDDYRSQLIVARDDYPKWDLAHLVLRPTGLSQAAYYWQILRLYYRVTMQPGHLWELILRHGPRENLKMMLGSTRITFQYLRKVLRHLGEPARMAGAVEAGRRGHAAGRAGRSG